MIVRSDSVSSPFQWHFLTQQHIHVELLHHLRLINIFFVLDGHTLQSSMTRSTHRKGLKEIAKPTKPGIVTTLFSSLIRSNWRVEHTQKR